ncbi:KAP family P-loop NTPase fold protein [Clostridium tagluense]|uniref:KAP NTPase domain-containing protein n=1 Tax=Clostridium tagluense TaxID=360422 RepID=A0A401UP48_9CLOT|nr:P-loop NTPase fold protein [Clostridium tagluense]GCD11313.1 hypothetical protein Ctaglu_29360 [Clostridium tagluense]
MNSEDIDKRNEEIERKEEEISNLDKKIDNVSYEMYGGPDDYDSDEELERMMNDPERELAELNRQKEKKKNEILKLKVDNEIKDNSKKWKGSMKGYQKGTPASDNETDKDLLDRSLYSKVIAEYLVNRKIGTPFNIGIFGEWGAGKSSFLKLIEKEIIKENKSYNSEINYYTHVVKYDASQYNEQNKIWQCILKEIFKEFEEQTKFKGKVSFFWNRFRKQLQENCWKYAISGITLILVVTWWIFFNKKVSDISQFKKILFYGFVGIIPLTMGAVNIVIPFIKGQLKIVKPLSDMVVSNIELPDYSKNLGIRENIKNDLTDLLEVWLKKDKKTKKYEKRLVIFVDELDRCSEKGITELFEALQLFLSVKQISIVISINFSSVYYALNKKVDKDITKLEKIRFCLDYLEKYISIPIYFNNIEKYDEYINSLLDDDKVTNKDELVAHEEVASTQIEELLQDDKKFVFDTDEKATIKEILKEANKYSHITPRTLKKIINILIVSKQISILVNEKSQYAEMILFNNYIKWFIFSYFNPKMSFEVQSIIKTKDYYHNMREALSSYKHEADSDNLIELLIINIYEVKVNEIKMFKNISNHFIPNENNLIK